MHVVIRIDMKFPILKYDWELDWELLTHLIRREALPYLILIRGEAVERLYLILIRGETILDFDSLTRRKRRKQINESDLARVLNH